MHEPFWGDVIGKQLYSVLVWAVTGEGSLFPSAGIHADHRTTKGYYAGQRHEKGAYLWVTSFGTLIIGSSVCLHAVFLSSERPSLKFLHLLC